MKKIEKKLEEYLKHFLSSNKGYNSIKEAIKEANKRYPKRKNNRKTTIKSPEEANIIEPELRPEYLERLRRIEKEGYGKSFSSIGELRKKIENKK